MVLLSQPITQAEGHVRITLGFFGALGCSGAETTYNWASKPTAREGGLSGVTATFPLKGFFKGDIGPYRLLQSSWMLRALGCLAPESRVFRVTV